uniref:Protein kinase domain-containing protein n=1 Tax=Globisporangium ultimum (strain ATCC 200006 / CBS 805.95 / DAOM BR144) TaxID=431595 RepID=K3WQM4_GLOUD
MFKHEVNVRYQLWHPHIVQLYGACHTGKRYFVCEYVSNGDLPEFTKRNQSDDVLHLIRSMTAKNPSERR